MCLSAVYKKTASGEDLLLKNVQRFSIEGDSVVFTDLLENDTRLTGRIIMADLVNGRVLVETE